MTRIEWTDEVWNPTTGCDRVSDGCRGCYALTMAARLKGMGHPKYQRDGDPRTSGPGFGLTVHPDVLALPLGWKKPRRIFVNSMSDLFHDDVPDSFIARVFAVMAATPRHTYQLLTKRHARMRSLLNNPEWRSDVFLRESVLDLQGPARPIPSWPLPNLWLGVSVESQQWADIRIPALLETPAAVRWLSMEPLLGPVELFAALSPECHCPDVNLEIGYYLDYCPNHGTDRRAIDWVVVGGESGPRARPMHPDWARSLRDQCASAGIPFFFKQHGEWGPLLDVFDYVTNDDRVQVVDTNGRLRGRPWPGWKAQDGTRDAEVMRRYGKKAAGSVLDGREWSEYPAVAHAAA